MMTSLFPVIYAFVLILLLWQAFRVMFRGILTDTSFKVAETRSNKDRTGKFTIHPELLDEEGNITEEDLLTVRFSNDLDPPKQTESSSE